MPADKFETFLAFNDPELAKFISDKLNANHIECVVENIKPILDKTIIGNSSDQNIQIKLDPQDFPKAHEVLHEYYATQLANVDEDYYLLSFSNEELREIVSKPDEWGHFDYQLAKKILNDRGVGFDETALDNLKDKRISELSKPEKASRLLIFFGYFFIIVGAIPGFLIGKHLFHDMRRLPNGVSVYTYEEADRKHGNRIMILTGCFIVVAGLFFLVWIAFT